MSAVPTRLGVCQPFMCTHVPTSTARSIKRRCIQVGTAGRYSGQYKLVISDQKMVGPRTLPLLIIWPGAAVWYACWSHLLTMKLTEYLQELQSFPKEQLVQPELKQHRQEQDKKLRCNCLSEKPSSHTLLRHNAAVNYMQS